jgi:5-methyltetrahydrofolate--homocysteine methyltransferase
MVSLGKARERHTPIEWRAEDIAVPQSTGIHVLDNFSLKTLREYIDWSPFFHAWGLKGLYPRILDDEKQGAEARELFTNANKMLDRIIAENLLTARGVYGLFPANAIGDDVELYTDASRSEVLSKLYFLRQQAHREGNEPCRSLADFIAPKTTALPDNIGVFAVTTGLGIKELVTKFREEHDDYSAIMAEAVADRLAEAFAEALHKQVRDDWGYGRCEKLSIDEMIREKYRGIRPAPGYPACPDHTEKGTIWKLLNVTENTGIQITESYAMWPGSSISGIYFAHPESRFFSLGKIDRDQADDYAQRKNWTLAEVERWLGPNLGYDPEA